MTMGRQSQLEEDVQYDDEHTVHYVAPVDATRQKYPCSVCHSKISTKDLAFQKLFRDTQVATEKVQAFLADRASQTQADDDQEVEHAQDELLQEHLRLASCVLGAKHWGTNLLSLHNQHV